MARYVEACVPERRRALKRCFDVADSCGARTLVIEPGYVDLDYRSEYSAYYSRVFARRPNNTHRLHFFKEGIDADDLWRLDPSLTYLGYVSVRPVSTGLVSRAMLRPPPDVADHVRTAVTERVNLFGTFFDVEGVPFAEQDAQFGYCAQACAWMCHFTAHLQGHVPRATKAEFGLHANPGRYSGRETGLTEKQIADICKDFGLPTFRYRIGQLPSSDLPWEPDVPDHVEDAHPGTWDTRTVPVICRHLNSGRPVIVACENGTSPLGHTFVLCGYDRKSNGSSRDGTRYSFVRHDDQVGPYLAVSNLFDDVDPITNVSYGKWTTVLAPTPERVWLPAEAAERTAADNLISLSHNSTARISALVGRPIPDLGQGLHDRTLALRTYSIESSKFKSELLARGMSERVAKLYRLCRLPKFVWVVEVLDKTQRDAGQPSVLGEALIDPTSSEFDPLILALHVPGVATATVDASGDNLMLIPSTDAPGDQFRIDPNTLELILATEDPTLYSSGGRGGP